MKIITFIILILISSCNRIQNTAENKKTESFQTEFELTDSDFVILAFDKDWKQIFKNVKSTELTQSEIIEIENILKTAVLENNERQKENLKVHNLNYPEKKWNETGLELKLNKKKRQYIPVINEKGEKEIWINLFCNPRGTYKWKTNLVIVKDGGNCYFNIKVNLTRKSYSELMINGYS